MAERKTNLTQRLVLEAPVRVADGGGGWQVSWTALGTHWAELKPSSARERMSGGRELSRVTHRVTVRSAPVGSARRPQPEQRFRQGERLLAIRGVAEADHRGAYLTCWVEEVPFA